MATHSPSDLELFHRFLSERLRDSTQTPEETVAAFRAEQQRIEELREELRPALERSQRGESGPIDINDIKACGRERLAAKGITD
jgi:hypothetical protein